MHPTLPNDFALPKAKPRVREWCEPGPSSNAKWRVQRVECWLDFRLQYALRTSCFNFSYFSSSTESTKSKFCKTHKVTDIRSAGPFRPMSVPSQGPLKPVLEIPAPAKPGRGDIPASLVPRHPWPGYARATEVAKGPKALHSSTKLAPAMLCRTWVSNVVVNRV